MLRYRLVIFDFDGTLADSFELFLETWKMAAERFGFQSVSEVNLEKLRQCSAREIIAEVGLPWWKLPLVLRFARAFMRDRAERVRLFEGVEAMLRQLKAEGIQVAIVTSNSQEIVEGVLGKETLGLIDHLACDVGIFGKKPKIRSVLKASGVPVPATLCVGDELRDAEAAQAMGIDFAAVSWGYTSPAQLEKLPDVKMCKRVVDIVSLAIV